MRESKGESLLLILPGDTKCSGHGNAIDFDSPSESCRYLPTYSSVTV